MGLVACAPETVAFSGPVACVSISFQLTPARGGRPSPRRIILSESRFNSLPREAGDFGIVPGRHMFLSFQLTPARGGRLWGELDFYFSVDVSTHSRARRETPRDDQSNTGRKFQLTPARGGRRRSGRGKATLICFNSLPREAGDGFLFFICCNLWCFNSLLRKAGDHDGAHSSGRPTTFQFIPRIRGRQKIRNIGTTHWTRKNDFICQNASVLLSEGAIWKSH